MLPLPYCSIEHFTNVLHGGAIAKIQQAIIKLNNANAGL